MQLKTITVFIGSVISFIFLRKAQRRYQERGREGKEKRDRDMRRERGGDLFRKGEIGQNKICIQKPKNHSSK